MRSLLQTAFVILLLIISHAAFAQGWVAQIDLDLNHDLYALEKINNAVLNFSGVSVSGSSSTSQLHFTISGNDPMSGNLSLSVNGLAWEPYDRSNPYSETLSASFSGSYRIPCETGFFQKQGESPQEQIYIWVKIYPRMQVSSFLQQCDKITLTTTTCSSRFIWEVSDSPSGNFKVMNGKSASSIVITRDELITLGFSDPYGRKYFRVTGVNKTTSQLQAIDVYYPGPTIALDPETPKCHDGNDGSVNINITSSVTAVNDFVVTLFSIQSTLLPLKQEVIMDATFLNFNGLLPGSYLIRVENSTSINTYGNCWTDAEFKLANPDSVSISSAKLSDFNGFNINCNGGRDGTIEVTASGGTGMYGAYQWVPSVSTSGIASNLAEGVYEVKVQDTNDCWSKPFIYRLTAPSSLDLSLIPTGGANGFGVSCHDKADGAIATEVSGGNGGYRYMWTDGSTLPARTGLTTGLYAVTVTDRNGCSISKQITLNAPSPIVFKINEISGITCSGSSSGALEVQSAVNTIGNISYRWSTGEPYPAIVDKPAGTYSVTITDEQGCTATRSHILVDAPLYSVKINAASDYHGSPIKCNGDASGALSAIIRNDKGEVASADNYTWYKNGVEITSGPSASTVSNLGAGIYRAEIRYRSQCRTENTFILEEPSRLTVNIANVTSHNGRDISCAGKKDAAITATASGGTGDNYSFLWSSGESTRELNNIGAGKYSVVVKDLNGCSAAAEKIVTEPAPLIGAIDVNSDYHGQPISCTNARDASIAGSAKGGTAPYFYEWSTGQTTPLLTGIGKGKYRLTIRDANGCTNSVDHTLADPEPMLVTLIDSSDYSGFGVSCNGSRDGYLHASASGGTGIYSYRWNDQPNAPPRYDRLKAGYYTVAASDQNGCQHSISRVITEPGPLTLNVSNVTAVSCHGGKDGTISLAATGGTGDYVFSSDNLVWQEDSVTTGVSSGVYVMFLQDGNGCRHTATATVPQPSPITIIFNDISPALCGDPVGAVSSAVSGGTAPYSYQWTNADQSFTGNTSALSELASGIYTLAITDYNYCSTSRSVAIAAADGPKAEIKDIQPATCAYSRDGSATVYITEGFGPYSFLWTNGSHAPIASDLAKGEYLVEIKDVNDCVTVEPVFIPGSDSLLVEIAERVEPPCYGSCDGKLVVSATGGNGGNTFIWASTTGPKLDQLCAGIYTVTVFDSKGCEAFRRFEVGEPEKLEVDLVSLRGPSCFNSCDGRIEISSSGGTGDLNMTWSNGHLGPAVTDLCAGNYVATITDKNLCQTTADYTLTEPEKHILEIGESAVICAGQSYSLDGGPSWKTFSWTSSTGFSSSNRIITINEPGTYWLNVVDENNCTARDTFLLKTSTDLLRAGFLMSSEVYAGDTLVIIDISWPLPESVSWQFPDEMQRISEAQDIVYGLFRDGGKYEVTLTAMSGECRDALTKQVVVLDTENAPAEEGRVADAPFVEEFSLFPNPNDGVFDVSIELKEAASVTLTIWSALTSRMVAQFQEAGSNKYLKHIDLRPLSPGPYALKLDYGKGTRYIRFIVR